MLANPNRKRAKECKLCLSEIMTIIVLFHMSSYRNFKDFYLNHVKMYLNDHFPNLVSYNRFIELMPHTAMPLLILLKCIQGKKTGVYYIDSTKIQVCHNLRISSHKVFKGLAKRGKTSTGWFFGFKLHIVINNQEKLWL